MKYPQLVSARAVSAINDWLVSRLEQLGVDAPLIYSRLLLSLLHTPLQINALDLAEISDVKSGSIGRKGNRRYSYSDTEALKRIAAIESLIKAVAADQQVSQIEKLIDELCEKLREIEKQNNVDDSQPTDTNDMETIKNQSPSPEDPTKRYYRAFPALSRDCSSDQHIRLSTKSLSWPNDNSSSSGIKQDKYTTGFANTAGVKRKPKRRRSNQGITKGKSFGRKYGNTSAMWDTEFEGTWEMGRDLIHEFVIKQNNRNRSISESDASKFVELNDIINAQKKITAASDQIGSMSLSVKDMFLAAAAAAKGTFFNPMADKSKFIVSESMPPGFNDTSILMIGQNLIRDQGHVTPDTLTCLPEIEHEMLSGMQPRRLYEREVSNESINAISTEDEAKAIEDDEHLARFEAKFNRNVEALWEDAEDTKASSTSVSSQDQYIDSFWHNYYKHLYNDPNTSSSLVSNSKPYFSYDNKLETITNQNIFGGNRNQTLLNKFSQGFHSLQDSIWSDNKGGTNHGNGADENSFYEISAIWENGQNSGIIKDASQMNMQHIASDDDMIQTAGYNLPNLLKWSDCPYDDTVEESALPPQHQPDILSTLPPSSPPPPPPPGFMQASVSFRSNSNKIRKNFFDNSYSLGYKSLPIMSNYKGIVDYDDREHLIDPSELRAATYDETQSAAKSENNEFLRKSSNVTLANHSANSGFIEVSPTSTQAVCDIGNNSHSTGKVPMLTDERNSALNKEKKFVRCMPTPSAEEENLLTSERTHFRPIKQTYTDGHTFVIPSNLDKITYTRSASGSLYLDSDKYMEYNPMVNDDSSSETDIDDEGLVLRFCVRQIEKCCQTDENSIDRHFNLSRMTRESILNCSTSSSGDDDDAGLLTPDIEMEYELKAYEPAYENGKHGSTLDMESWASGENKQKCLNNNNSHALWEHCSACECDIISVPANRLLKDELSADGDEIMSDLKYMQNLYIGSDWEDDGTDEDDDACQPLENDQNQNAINMPAESDAFFYNVNKFISDLLKPETAKTLVRAFEQTTNHGNNIINEFVLQENGQNLDAKITLSNDNITNKTDQSADGNMHNCVDLNANNNNNNNNISEKYIGGLWSNDENSIWRKEIQSTNQSEQQQEGIWLNINNNNINNNGNAKQNWEHAHLEEIWNDDNKMANNADFKMLADKFQPPEHTNMAADLDDDIFYDSNELSYDLTKLVDANDSNIFDPAATNITIKKRNNSYGNGKEFQISKINRFDRKRRHSASQNINDTHESFGGSCGNDYDGGGGDDGDGGCGCGGRISLGARITVDSLNAIHKSSHNHGECAATRKMSIYPGALNVTTIITCNYWAAPDSSSYLDEKSDGTILMNPSSILKNVAMASRPLTR